MPLASIVMGTSGWPLALEGNDGKHMISVATLKASWREEVARLQADAASKCTLPCDRSLCTSVDGFCISVTVPLLFSLPRDVVLRGLLTLQSRHTLTIPVPQCEDLNFD